jgi:hypothetical protein
MYKIVDKLCQCHPGWCPGVQRLREVLLEVLERARGGFLFIILVVVGIVLFVCI